MANKRTGINEGKCRESMQKLLWESGEVELVFLIKRKERTSRHALSIIRPFNYYR